ncbi:MAG: hypothetical protein JXN64_06410 [Spirochaetes bacterium]|nr:hypothetical protein [Spirochaetota bacterium]
MKYIVVYHEWFVDASYWNHEIIETISLTRAEQIAALNLKNKSKNNIHRLDFYIVPMEESNVLKVKLTLRERLKGVIKFDCMINNIKMKN